MLMKLDRVKILLLLVVLEAGALTSQPELQQFLQPDDVGDPGGSTSKGDPSRRCDRPCVLGEKPKLCYYHFTLENYHTMGAACGSCPNITADCFLPQCVTADGYERGIYTVNRRMPGPSIQVCLGDRLVVDVHNLMPGRTTTIHYHGLLQDGSNHMDGVPMVTQCPITEGSTFRYNFIVKDYGTYFYHSHEGIQKMDGVQGSLIVRQPKSLEPNLNTYDRDLPEHVIIIADWMEVDGDQKFPGLRMRAVGQEPTSYLVNGKGRLPIKATTSTSCTHQSIFSTFMNIIKKPTTSDIITNTNTPLMVYTVKHSLRYRMRLIGGTCLHCPAEIAVEGHRLRLIATDGSHVKPVYVDKIVFLPGERYDFVLEATQNIRSYWIHVRGLGPCEATGAYQLAVLKYAGSNQEESSTADPGYEGLQQATPVTLNPVDAKCGPNDNNVCVDQLTSSLPVDPRLMAADVDLRIVLEFDFFEYTEEKLFRTGTYHRFLRPIVPVLLAGYINNISSVLPASPILSQSADIDQQSYCASGNNGYTKCNADLCECFHLLRVPYNKVIEIVYAHVAPVPDDLHHPFHMHGHKFHVVKVSKFPENARGQRGIAMLRNFELESRDAFIKNRQEALDKEWREEADENETTKRKTRDVKNGQQQGVQGGEEKKGKRKQSRTWFPGKDSVAVPTAGYAVTRFISSNPGYWMIHCHFIYHQLSGMHLVMQIGENNTFTPVPSGFPKCGGFEPKVDIGPYV